MSGCCAMDGIQPATLGIGSQDLGELGAAAARDMGGICLDNGDSSPSEGRATPNRNRAGERTPGGTPDTMDAGRGSGLSEPGSEEDGKGSGGSDGTGLEASPEGLGWDMGSPNGDKPEEDRLEQTANSQGTPSVDSPAPSSSYTGRATLPF